MEQNCIITISRQYGSGGRYIGSLLAQQLELPFYDREIIRLAAERSGFSAQVLETLEEQPSGQFFYSGPAGQAQFAQSVHLLPPQDKIFLAQFQVIREAACKGPCVIIGRGADYVLRGMPNVVNIFIHSSLENRVKRAVKYYGLQEDSAEKTITKTDKKRASYHERYTDTRWGVAANYHLCIDSDSVGIDNSVELIRRFAEMKTSTQ